MAGGDEWPVCASCVAQAKRTRAKVAHRALRPGESWEDPTP